MNQSSAAGASLASRPVLWWSLSVAALVIGYADLWRGGMTVAPILLVLGYCVLIPIAIMK
jgi:hypothetical protein